MAEFMRIQFTASAIYETEGYRKGPKFEPGEVYDCAADWGRRWIERGVADEIDGAKDPGAGRWALVPADAPAPPAKANAKAPAPPTEVAAPPAA